MIVLQNQRLLKITVDNVLTKHENTIRVLFLATEKNTILKYILLNFLDEESFNKIKPLNSQTTLFSSNPVLCLLEEIDVFDSNPKYGLLNSINNLVFLKNGQQSDNTLNRYGSDFNHQSRNLLIATKFNIIKMPVANCESRSNYFSCLSLMDPYW